MIINYVAFLDPFHYHGGGEMIVKDLIDCALKLGHEVNITSIKPRQINFNKSADITILCDLFNEPSLNDKFDFGFIDNIISNYKYLHMDNSYVDTCDLDYLPCNGVTNFKCQSKSLFNFKSNFKRKSISTKCFQDNSLIKKIYNKSLSNIFLSPLHHETIAKMIGIENRPFFILRPTVDTEKFFNKKQNRDIEYIFAGAISEAKGANNLIKYFEGTEKELSLIGNNIFGKKMPFARFLGFIPYNEMPNYFNRAKNFIYLPRWPEPQGRVVVEAALCGCNLITNENVGATSFDFDISLKHNLDGATTEFWEYVFGQLI